MIGNKKTVKLKKAKKKVKWKIVAGKKNISIKKKGKLKNKLIVKGKKSWNIPVLQIRCTSYLWKWMPDFRNFHERCNC